MQCMNECMYIRHSAKLLGLCNVCMYVCMYVRTYKYVCTKTQTLHQLWRLIIATFHRPLPATDVMLLKNTASSKTMDSYENGVTGTATLINLKVPLITCKNVIGKPRYKQTF